VEEFLRELGAGPWGYLGIFLAIVATGVGFPMPEELPVVVGGLLAGSAHVNTWLMLLACICGVIVGDSFLYGIGRLWGPRLLRYHWVKTKLLPPERLQKIEDNFQKYGVRILLFARLTPGIRAPIFFTAGLTRLPASQFLLADGIYAVPGVSLLFFLGYWLNESVFGLIRGAEHFKNILIIGVIGVIAVYILYRMLRRPVVTGSPKEMPKVVEQVTHGIEHGIEKVSHGLEMMKTKIIHPHKTVRLDATPPPEAHAARPPVDGEAPRTEPSQPAQEPGGPGPRP
jgi:membrane protein DedA with SNARE-associated domain